MLARGVGVRYNMGADQMDVRALFFAPTPTYHWPEKGQLQQGAIPHPFGQRQWCCSWPFLRLIRRT